MSLICEKLIQTQVFKLSVNTIHTKSIYIKTWVYEMVTYFVQELLRGKLDTFLLLLFKKYMFLESLFKKPF